MNTPQGIRYSRNGMFSLDRERRLVNGLGYPVMGTKGEIKIPPGKLEITTQGAIKVDDKPVATIKVMEFARRRHAAEVIGRAYSSPRKAKWPRTPQIQVGHIEESNVNSIGEMVKMIQGMRNYESTQKLIQTLDRMAEVAIQDVGRVL